MRLLTFSNPKIQKSVKRQWLGAILHLLPSDTSGLGNLCPGASRGCRQACLNTAGRGWMPIQAYARLQRTRLWFDNRQEFLELLTKDLHSLETKAKKLGFKPCVRLNGTSDIPWERHGVIEQFPGIQFYDYTKIFKRMTLQLSCNYYLCFSRSETKANHKHCQQVLEMGRSVAAVFRSPFGDLPTEYQGVAVVDGDSDDLRFLDSQGCYVGLRPKGKAKHDNSGFVIDVS